MSSNALFYALTIGLIVGFLISVVVGIFMQGETITKSKLSNAEVWIESDWSEVEAIYLTGDGRINPMKQVGVIGEINVTIDGIDKESE